MNRLLPLRQVAQVRSQELRDEKAGVKSEAEGRITEVSSIRVVDGFFPTPTPLATRMARFVGLTNGMDVLEPEAGTGKIVVATQSTARELGISVNITMIEYQSKFCTFLRNKFVGRGKVGIASAEVLCMDFLQFQGKQFDVVLMNPPFADFQDYRHVRHAYYLLKPRGILVGIMGESIFNNSFKTASEFRRWFEDVGGYSEKLPEGTFRESGTGTSTRFVVIDKR